MPSAKPQPPAVDREAGTKAAIAARRARAAIKSAMRSGSRSALDVLFVAVADPTTAEASLRITDFLSSIRGIGKTKMVAILEQLHISDRKRLGGLGVSQRESLKKWLLERYRRLGYQHPVHLVVLAGPTAVGKGTITQFIQQHFPEVHLSVSATTRQPRPGEKHEQNYFFLSSDEFDNLIEQNELLEWALVHGQHKYGTPRQPIEQALSEGRPVLLEIDLQGARKVKEAFPTARTIFVLPPSWQELERRLQERGTEDADEQSRRLSTAATELEAQHEFDVRITNHEVTEAAKQVVELMGLIKE